MIFKRRNRGVKAKTAYSIRIRDTGRADWSVSIEISGSTIKASGTGGSFDDAQASVVGYFRRMNVRHSKDLAGVGWGPR